MIRSPVPEKPLYLIFAFASHIYISNTLELFGEYGGLNLDYIMAKKRFRKRSLSCCEACDRYGNYRMDSGGDA